MKYLKWLFLVIFGLLLTLVQVVLSPLLALWPKTLPWWLNWFQTQDYDLMGDGGHQQRWKGWPPYIQRLAWLLRNPTDGYDNGVCGCAVDDPKQLVWSGDRQTGNIPGHSGTFRASYGDYWSVYYVRQWGSSGLCIRAYLGWKLKGALDAPPGRYSMVSAVNPWMKYERSST